jgi:hypothetical protein
MLAIGAEWPMSWLRTIEPLPKFHLELLHLRRFSTDQAVATGHDAFSDVQQGNDPPDATVLTDAGRIGVECTRADGRRPPGRTQLVPEAP